MKLSEHPYMEDPHGLSDHSRTSNVVPMILADPEHRKNRRAQEAQRLVFYLAAGVVSMLFLVMLAKQMTPPDAALVNAPLSRVIGLWEGRWEGRESRFTLTGSRISSSEATRTFTSSTPNFQSALVERRDSTGAVQRENWSMRVDQDGVLKARRTPEGSEVVQLFNGSVDGDTFFWTAESDERQEVVRIWLTGTVLNIEELHIEKNNPSLSYIVSGRYERRRE